MWKGFFRCLAQATLFPETCVACESWVVNRDFIPLCPACSQLVAPIRHPTCCVCGIPLPGNLSAPLAECRSCHSGTFSFHQALAFGPFEKTLAQIIRAYKFAGRKRLSIPLAGLLLQIFQEKPLENGIDWIIPVPSHIDRLQERGFDHVRLLAERFARSTGIPIFTSLKRHIATSPQVGLSMKERRRNLRGAFRLNDQSQLFKRRVILLDDVMTTGTTANEISRLLLRQGHVSFVGVLTVARACRRFT